MNLLTSETEPILEKREKNLTDYLNFQGKTKTLSQKINQLQIDTNGKGKINALSLEFPSFVQEEFESARSSLDEMTSLQKSWLALQDEMSMAKEEIESLKKKINNFWIILGVIILLLIILVASLSN